MRKVEILAPAGSYESLCGAINGGCDAVYLGGNRFGARAFAENFDEQTMLKAIDYVHTFDKQLYLTVNTLLHNEEIENELYEYLRKYYMQGLDAVIVQDVGVLSFIHKNFPQLPIHASTQMTFTTEMGAELIKDQGVTRFVTSRELGIKELKEIRKHTDLEIETFVHGALCYCYSGQCFLSSMIGGRSGNRGRCAQPCRMQYQVMDASGERVKADPFVLSPKDMCTLDRIPDLVDAGIDSFKIEGRMKKPEYATYTAHLYRKYTDLYLEYGKEYPAYLRKHKRELEYDYTCLMDLYNRGGFSTGYFYDHNGPKTMSMVRPNHSGVYVGSVKQMKKNRAEIQVEEDLYAQDVLEFRREDGKVLYEYTVKDAVKKGNTTQTNTKPGSKIFPGTALFRTRRNALLQYIRDEILENQKRISVSFHVFAKVGEPLQVVCSGQNTSVTVEGQVVEVAQSRPMTKDNIRKQFGKLNTTVFSLEECVVELEGEVFLPIGQLNEVRRQCVEALKKKICERYRREEGMCFQTMGKREDSSMSSRIVVFPQTIDQAIVADKKDCVEEIYLDLALLEEQKVLSFLENCSKAVSIVLPAIIREKEYALYDQAFANVYERNIVETELEQILSHSKVNGLLAKNYEAIALYKMYVEGLNIWKCRLDYNVYTFNREAKEFWRGYGIRHSTASVELNGAEWVKNGCEDQAVMVYGRPAVMTSTQCVRKNTKGCSGKAEMLVLEDRFGKELVNYNRCQYCYNQMYEMEPVSLHEYLDEILEMKPEQLRLDFLMETEEEVSEIIEFYSGLISGECTMECPIREFQIGHYSKGVM